MKNLIKVLMGVFFLMSVGAAIADDMDHHDDHVRARVVVVPVRHHHRRHYHHHPVVHSGVSVQIGAH